MSLANWLLPLCIWLVFRPVLRPRLVPVVYRFGLLTKGGYEKRGRGCPYIGADLLVSGTTGPTIRVRDMGTDTTYV